MNDKLEKAIEEFQKSEDWAYYKDHEKREIAFRAGVKHITPAVIALCEELAENDICLGGECRHKVLKSCITCWNKWAMEETNGE